MIWTLLFRASVLLSVGVAVKQLYDQSGDIGPNRVYTTQQVASLIGVDRKTVIQMVKDKEINGKIVDGTYKIPGQAILDYLTK